jgi:hypothetical protein
LKMPTMSYNPMPAEGKEIPISILGIDQREEMLWIASEPTMQDNFPPCIKNIIQKNVGEKGRHRRAAILAAFLGQVGYAEIEAKPLWSKVANVEERIFQEWFQKMHCPKCETLKGESRAYPNLGIADLDLCQPDEKCREFTGPVEYAARLIVEGDWSKGRQQNIKTIYQARIFDWTQGREGEIELSLAEKDKLEGLQKEQTENEVLVYTRAKVRGKLRPKFFLKETEGPRKRVLSEFL